MALFTNAKVFTGESEGAFASAPGFDGSFAVLDRDVFSVPEDELPAVRVAETWIDGARVFVR